jgi:alpha-glucoside transport system substrate-binding protein
MRTLSLRRGVVLGVIAALAGAACAPGASNNSSSNTVHGGSVSVLGVWSGAELDAFNAVVAPFTASTGIKVTFEASRDQDAILTTRVAAGDPPDLAAAPSPALLTKFANQKKLISLQGIIDQTKLKAEYDKSWIDLGTVNGNLVEVFSWASPKGFIWYDPKIWTAKGYTVPKTWADLIALQTKMKSNGDTPWCIAVESGPASGWAGSDIQKEITLSQSGPSIYDSWWQGKQAWNSTEIKSAWTTFGTLLGPGDANVYGGANYVVNTNFGEVGTPMFASPPKCMMLNQASFITSFFTKANPNLVAGADYNFFPMPDVNSKYAGARVVSGDAWSMFKDTPQARALIQYLVTADAQAIWAKIPGSGKISPNKKVTPDVYPDPISKSIAQATLDTKVAKYDAGDLMPADMKNAYWSAIIAFIQDQSKLDSILAGLEKVRSTAYTAA